MSGPWKRTRKRVRKIWIRGPRKKILWLAAEIISGPGWGTGVAFFSRAPGLLGSWALGLSGSTRRINVTCSHVNVHSNHSLLIIIIIFMRNTHESKLLLKSTHVSVKRDHQCETWSSMWDVSIKRDHQTWDVSNKSEHHWWFQTTPTSHRASNHTHHPYTVNFAYQIVGYNIIPLIK